MDAKLQEVRDAFEHLGVSIQNGTHINTRLSDHYGFNHPPLTRFDLAELAFQFRDKIDELAFDEVSDEIHSKLNSVNEKITSLITQTLPYFYNGNGVQAIPAYLAFIEWCKLNLSFLFEWQSNTDKTLLPPALAKRLKMIQSGLDEIVPEKTDLERRINLISEATETAESLPESLETLKESQGKIDKIEVDSGLLYLKIEDYEKKAANLFNLINDKNEEAKRTLVQIADAYSITTTKGLAASFELRAKSLNYTVVIWVVLLITVLGGGAIIGSYRFQAFSDTIKGQTSTAVIIMEFIISVISVGAPIWFAWIATKQIAQRFRLAEDYAFKAAVAKAYEGYKKEAARLDKKFELRLFDSALARLEEAPLRLMDTDTHGSPWHELLTSPKFIKMLDTAPDLRDKLINLATEAISSSKTRFKSKNSISENTEE